MKHLKTKLMASVVMLLIATVLMSTASYAWFTISTAPEIKGMTAKVVVNENLEVALLATSASAPTAIPAAAAIGDSDDKPNKAGDYTWGNLINLKNNAAAEDGSAAKQYSAIDKTLRPAGLCASAGTPTGMALNDFYYPKYGTDGRITELAKITAPTAYGMANLVGSGDNLVYGYYMDVWVRTNVGGDLQVIAPSTTAVKRSANGEDGEGSYFKMSAETDADKKAAQTTLGENIRLAFLDVTPDITGAEKAADDAAAVILTGTVDSANEAQYNFSSTNIVTLKANQAKLIRIFVYLDGANVTNAAASLDTWANQGDINIQFAMTNVDNSMDKVPAAS